jgi:uncharacterized protein Yka (UPF0111/DUF47 family)
MPRFKRSPNHLGLSLAALENLASAAVSLHDLVESRVAPLQASKDIASFEQQGGKLTYQLNQRVQSSSALLGEREDFFELSNRINDVLDCIHGISRLIVLFKVQPPIASATALAGILKRTAVELLNGMKLLNQNQSPARTFVKLRALTDEAEELYSRVEKDLLAHEPDALNRAKHKRICARLDAAVSRLQEVAGTLECIAIQYPTGDRR